MLALTEGPSPRLHGPEGTPVAATGQPAGLGPRVSRAPAPANPRASPPTPPPPPGPLGLGGPASQPHPSAPAAGPQGWAAASTREGALRPPTLTAPGGSPTAGLFVRRLGHRRAGCRVLEGALGAGPRGLEGVGGASGLAGVGGVGAGPRGLAGGRGVGAGPWGLEGGGGASGVVPWSWGLSARFLRASPPDGRSSPACGPPASSPAQALRFHPSRELLSGREGLWALGAGVCRVCRVWPAVPWPTAELPQASTGQHTVSRLGLPGAPSFRAGQRPMSPCCKKEIGP